MESNELRIGNFVDVNGKIIEVEDIHPEGINQQIESSYYGSWETDYLGYAIDWDGRVVKPIKLVEEWLLKFGFDDMNDKDIKAFAKGFNYIESDEDFEYAIAIEQDVHGNWYTMINGRKIIIEFVHDLQNLIYVLTKTELTIK